jgi:hypothetical protein
VPNSWATLIAAAEALELVAAAEEPVVVPELLGVLEAVPAEAEALEEELATRAVALRDPQTKDWQKVWPAKSLG